MPDTLAAKAGQKIQCFTSTSTNPRASGIHFSAEANPKLIDQLKKARTIAVVDTSPRFDSAGKPFPTIVCPDPLGSYVELMRQIRLEADAWVIAVTGSDGKTVTKEMLRAVLQTTHATHWNRGTASVFGQIGLTIQNMPEDTDVYVQEVGEPAPGRVPEAAEMLAPHAVVYANVGLTHPSSFGSREAFFGEMLSLDDHLTDDGVVFANFDDHTLANATFGHPVISFGINRPELDFTALDIEVSGGKQTFSVLEQSTGTKTPVVVHVLGEHNISNALAAFAVGRWIGVSATDAARGISRFRPLGTRQNLVALAGHKVLVDCFSSSEPSVLGMAQALKSIVVPRGARRFMVLGDMPALGEYSESVHARVGSELASIAEIDALYCVGKETKVMAREASRFGKTVFHFDDKESLGHDLDASLRDGDAIAFKAGGPTALATVIDKIFGSEFMFFGPGHLERKTTRAEGMRFTLISNYGAELTSLESVDDNIRLRFGDHVSDCPLIRIGKGACKESNLTEIILYDPILSVGSSAFRGSKNLQYVEFPGTLRLIDVDAFRDCTALEEIFLPEGLQTLRRGAFHGCTSLRSIIIPRSLRTIDRGAFSDCPDLKVFCHADAPTTTSIKKQLTEKQFFEID